jgi:hypothetical protein
MSGIGKLLLGILEALFLSGGLLFQTPLKIDLALLPSILGSLGIFEMDGGQLVLGFMAGGNGSAKAANNLAGSIS